MSQKLKELLEEQDRLKDRLLELHLMRGNAPAVRTCLIVGNCTLDLPTEVAVDLISVEAGKVQAASDKVNQQVAAAEAAVEGV